MEAVWRNVVRLERWGAGRMDIKLLGRSASSQWETVCTHMTRLGNGGWSSPFKSCVSYPVNQHTIIDCVAIMWRLTTTTTMFHMRSTKKRGTAKQWSHLAHVHLDFLGIHVFALYPSNWEVNSHTVFPVTITTTSRCVHVCACTNVIRYTNCETSGRYMGWIRLARLST